MWKWSQTNSSAVFWTLVVYKTSETLRKRKKNEINLKENSITYVIAKTLERITLKIWAFLNNGKQFKRVNLKSK